MTSRFCAVIDFVCPLIVIINENKNIQHEL